MGFWDEMLSDFQENVKREIKTGIGTVTNEARDRIAAANAPKAASASTPVVQVVQNPMFQSGAVIIAVVVVGYLLLSSRKGKR